MVCTGPRRDCAECASLQLGYNAAAVSRFDEAAVDLCRLLASLIVLALWIEQFALPLPRDGHPDVTLLLIDIPEWSGILKMTAVM